MTFEELLEAAMALKSANGNVNVAAKELGIGVGMTQLNVRVMVEEVEVWRQAAGAGRNLSRWIREKLNDAAVAKDGEKIVVASNPVRQEPPVLAVHSDGIGQQPVPTEKPKSVEKIQKKISVAPVRKEAPKYPSGFVPATALDLAKVKPTGKLGPDALRHLNPQLKVKKEKEKA